MKPQAAPVADRNFPLKIAVLPVNNMAGDADGAVILRALIKHKLERDLKYTIQPFDETDRTIRDRTLTGDEIPVQVVLARTDAKLLTTWLGVDGLLHAELLAFNRAQLSVYTRSQVKAHFWLTDKSGTIVWEGHEDTDSGSLGGGRGSISLASYLTDSGISPDALEKIDQSPLGNETMGMVDNTFSSFPRRP